MGTRKRGQSRNPLAMPLVLLITASTSASPPLTLRRKSQTSATTGRKQLQSHASFEAGRGKTLACQLLFSRERGACSLSPREKGRERG